MRIPTVAGGVPRRVVLATVAGCLALAGVGGFALAATGTTPVPSAPPARHSAPAGAPTAPAQVRAATPFATPSHDSVDAAKLQPAAAAGVAQVAPLRALTPPDVAVVLPTALPATTWARVLHLPGVVAATVAARGAVDTPAGRLLALGVDPAQFRGFTPKLSAESDPLWQAVASGEAAFDFSTETHLRPLLGAQIPIGATSQRLGAFASLGISGVAVVVDRATGEQLGLATGRELVVAAPSLSIGTLSAELTGVLGSSAQIQVLRPQPVYQQQVSSVGAGYIPAEYLALYRQAALTCPGLPWTVLAAIGTVETGNGADVHESTAGAEGPMQFLPSTFAVFGVAVGPDHTPNINSPADAIFSAARYLCAEGAGLGGQSLDDAIFAYNHADWYVREVLAIARLFS